MKYHINILELLALKLVIQTFTKYRDVKAIHLQCKQYIFDENGGYSKFENGWVGQGNLGISFEVGDHSCCRIPPKRIECSSRMGISKQFEILRVGAESSNFSQSLSNKGFSRDRFFCIPSITSDTNLRCMDTRSTQSCNRCISTEFGTQIHENLSIKSPNLVPWRRDLLKNPKGEIHPLVQNMTLQLVAYGFRARLQEEGISKADADPISRSRRPNSNANYESAWRKWASWCSRRKIYSFSSNINEILEYFTGLYKQGLQYRTIDNHRSAISAFHEQIQRKPLWEHDCYENAINSIATSSAPIYINHKMIVK